MAAKAQPNQTLNIVDNLSPDIGLRTQQRTEVAQALAKFLATNFILTLKTLNYHWNVTGPHFTSLHKLFEKQYNALNKAGDEVAERIRALGHMTPGTTWEFCQMSAVIEDKALPRDATMMVRNLLADNETASQAARAVLKKAEEMEDEVTVDMMIERMTYHDEAAWMLRATAE